MSLILNCIVGFILGLSSYLDLKFKRVPSVILTGLLLVVAMLNPYNLWFGVTGFIFAYLLYELDFFSGVADIKVLTILFFMLNSFWGWCLIPVLITSVGVIWKGVFKLSNKKKKNVAFIPVLTIVYLILLIVGVIN